MRSEEVICQLGDVFVMTTRITSGVILCENFDYLNPECYIAISRYGKK